MGRRRQIVYVSAEILENLVKPMGRPGEWVRWDGGEIPEDAHLVGTGYDFERNQVWMVFEHPSFRETGDGFVPRTASGPMFTALSGRHLVAEFEVGQMTAEKLRADLRVPGDPPAGPAPEYPGRGPGRVGFDALDAYDPDDDADDTPIVVTTPE